MRRSLILLMLAIACTKALPDETDGKSDFIDGLIAKASKAIENLKAARRMLNTLRNDDLEDISTHRRKEISDLIQEKFDDLLKRRFFKGKVRPGGKGKRYCGKGKRYGCHHHGPNHNGHGGKDRKKHFPKIDFEDLEPLADILNKIITTTEEPAIPEESDK